MRKLSDNPTTDITAKLVVVALGMFAFVFVVMVPLYDVLCDALGINGKTSGQAYTAAEVVIDEARSVKIQFIATTMKACPGTLLPAKG